MTSYKSFNPHVETHDELIIEHQKKRILELSTILSKCPGTCVIIPPCTNYKGHVINCDDVEILTDDNKHIVPPIVKKNGVIKDKNNNIIDESTYNSIVAALGTGTAGYEKNDKKFENIQMLVKYIIHRFPEKVKFGYIGELAGSDDYPVEDEISSKVIHLFGANENNWNVSKDQYILGGGQAGCFKYQRPGVFGIVTMVYNKNIEYLRNNLFSKSNTKYY